jgi:hypothetical protein
MSDKTSLQVYEWWLEAAHKFDYFIAGISTALAGYLGQNFRPERLGWSPGLLELLSMLAFVGAVVASLKRIESTVHALRVNAQKLEKREKAVQLAEAIDLGTPLRFRETGEMIDSERLQQEHTSHEELVKAAQELIEKIQVRTQRWYAARIYFLVSGFLLLIAARIWQPYS